jgi:hypothetical protein
LSLVRPVVVTVRGSAAMRFSAGPGRGVVVTSARGRAPSRRLI